MKAGKGCRAGTSGQNAAGIDNSETRDLPHEMEKLLVMTITLLELITVTSGK
ncbi:hypothetical protein M975_4102 [Buttiauxella brennerae ATCC 51605]|uniref:Uncharacterized protein n=1 Tax=Buttiauxella brennerae ATCC 51605 TaxID=1354251 RepID=A0A1B7IDZ9_9ENTR|nr:hypothetical protein M975_4102 [Buttiauxella brennerae ATCC 51605]